MGRPRLRAPVAVLFATIVAAGVMVAVPATAQAASVTEELVNYANGDCLTAEGYGYGGVIMEPCGGYWGPAQDWTITTQSGYDTIQSSNGGCLDGREGTGNLTVAACGVDGTHQHWLEISELDDNNYYVWGWENQFNAQCMSGWLGYVVYGFDVAMLQPCGSGNENQWWNNGEG
jgi:Ricin-type beta-trefoil lectin domain